MGLDRENDVGLDSTEIFTRPFLEINRRWIKDEWRFELSVKDIKISLSWKLQEWENNNKSTCDKLMKDILPEGGNWDLHWSPSATCYKAPPNGEDYTSPPNEEDYTAAPNLEDYTSPPYEEDYTSPPNGEDYTAPRNGEDYTAHEMGKTILRHQIGKTIRRHRIRKRTPVHNSSE